MGRRDKKKTGLKAVPTKDRWAREKYRKKFRIFGRVEKRIEAIQKTLALAQAQADKRFQEKTADLRAELEEKTATLNKIRDRFIARLNEGVKEEREALGKLEKQRAKLKDQMMALSNAELVGEELDEEDVDDSIDEDIEETLEETEDLLPEEDEPVEGADEDDVE